MKNNFNLDPSASVPAEFFNKRPTLPFRSLTQEKFEELILRHLKNSNTKFGTEQIFTLVSDLNNKDFIKNTSSQPVAVASKFCREDALNLMLKYGFNIDIKDKEEKTALYKAVESQQINQITMLITLGADVNPSGPEKNTTLHIACIQGNPQIVKLLLNAEGDPDVQNLQRNTPMHYAAMNNPEIVNMLIAKGANINEVNRFDQTALMIAINNKQQEIAELLIKKDINIKADTFGNHPLHYAAEVGLLEIIKMLLEKEPDETPLNDLSENPLHFAVKGRQIAVVQFLVSNKKLPDAQDIEGNSPLHLVAADPQAIAIGKILMENKADVKLCNEKKKTPVDIAVAAGNQGLILYMLSSHSARDLSTEKTSVEDIIGLFAKPYPDVLPVDTNLLPRSGEENTPPFIFPTVIKEEEDERKKESEEEEQIFHYPYISIPKLQDREKEVKNDEQDKKKVAIDCSLFEGDKILYLDVDSLDSEEEAATGEQKSTREEKNEDRSADEEESEDRSSEEENEDESSGKEKEDNNTSGSSNIVSRIWGFLWGKKSNSEDNNNDDEGETSASANDYSDDENTDSDGETSTSESEPLDGTYSLSTLGELP